VSKSRLGLVVLLGTVLVYLLNAVRIYGLVVAGTLLSPRASVSLAHSRISGIGFLGVMVLLLAGTSGWCRGRGAFSVAEGSVSA
jgi:exosortase/archaeosortase family protein